MPRQRYALVSKGLSASLPVMTCIREASWRRTGRRWAGKEEEEGGSDSGRVRSKWGGVPAIGSRLITEEAWRGSVARDETREVPAASPRALLQAVS